MKKQIRQVTGTQVGITFTKEEREIHGIELGGWIDLDDAIFYKKTQIILSQIEPQYRQLVKDAIKQHEKTQ